jgi:glutathione S-transferase
MKPDFQHRHAQSVKKLTGNSWVPAVVTDGGEVVSESKNIVAWAETHPAVAPAQTA